MAFPGMHTPRLGKQRRDFLVSASEREVAWQLSILGKELRVRTAFERRNVDHASARARRLIAMLVIRRPFLLVRVRAVARQYHHASTGG